MSASEKRIEKLEAKVVRLTDHNSRLKGKIADIKAKRAAARSVKAGAASGARRAPKRRTPARGSSRAAAAATA